MSEQSLAIRQALGVERLAEHLYRSGYWSDARSQSQAIVKILAGAELDIGPITAMNGVFVIEGRTSLAAHLIAARIQSSKNYRYRVVVHDDSHCVIDFFEIVDGKREKLGTSKFDMDDAKKAGLLDRKGGMWLKYPRNMVFSRALSNGAKWYTPAVFHGAVYTPDELGAEVDESGNVIEGSYAEVPAAPAAPSVPTREREVDDASPQRMITNVDDRVWKRWQSVRSEAIQFGVVPPDPRPPIAFTQLVSIGEMVKAQTQDRKDKLAEEDAARAAGAVALQERQGVSPSEMAQAWEANRTLMENAFAAGLRLRELRSTATLEEVQQRNDEIRLALEQQQDT